MEFSIKPNNLIDDLNSTNRILYPRNLQEFIDSIDLNPKDTDYETYLSIGYYFTRYYHFSSTEGPNSESLAIEACQKAIALKQDDANVYNIIGLSYEHSYDYEKAILAYRKAIALKPDNADTYYNMGVSYDSKLEYYEAIDAYKKTIDLKPDYIKAYNNMGISYDNLGEYDKAIEAYQKAIAIKSDYAVAYNNMGSSYYMKKDYSMQKQCYKKAARLGDIDSKNWLEKNGETW